MVYVPKDYWSRLHDRNDLSSVGQRALPDGVNQWIYRSIRRNLRRFARRHGLVGAAARMLEVGVGSGYWIDFWQELGWRVDGCDLVPAAVQRLSERHPHGRFWAADVGSSQGIGAPDAVQDPGYDLVTATSVLLHVTNDRAFRTALANCAAAVNPGGHLLLVEPMLLGAKREAPFNRAAHSRARVLRSYVEPLRALGLELVAIEATTVLAANPLEAGSPRRLAAYARWWDLVLRSRNSAVLAKLIGPLMYLGDGILMRTGRAPTSKIMLFAKVPS